MVPSVKLFTIGLIAITGLSRLSIAQELTSTYDPTFAASSIDQSIVGSSDAIVRLSVMEFRIDGPGSASLDVRKVVTVMNPAGRDDAELTVSYDRQIRPLEELDGRLLDASGNNVRDLSKDDQEDYSASGSDLFNDTRIRTAELFHDQYPYTVEFEYKLRYKGIVAWPGWGPQSDGLPVEFARFIVNAAESVEVRYAGDRMDIEPTVSKEGKRTQYIWTLARLPAFEKEPWGPGLWEQVPVLYTAPSEFEIEDASGRMRTWAEFGRWYHQINRGRSGLPEEARSEIRALTRLVEDPMERVRLVYEHMQSNTRYVSVQLGIGGWQTNTAESVYTSKYGDCKALTNYTMALLKEADVTSFPVLIRNGFFADDILTDFSCNQFNHVLLMVPVQADTLWLECTSQTSAFGHIGASNEGRTALLITAEGGKLVRTPESRPDANAQFRTATIRLGDDGTAVADVSTTYSGNQRWRVVDGFRSVTDRDRGRWIVDELDAPNFEILQADFGSIERGEQVVSLPLTLRKKGYGSVSGSRVFFQPKLADRWTSVPPPVEQRTQPVIFQYRWADTDSLEWILPEDSSVEALPEPVELAHPFGYYKAEISQPSPGVLVYTRTFELREDRIPAEQYEELRSFLTAVSRADQAKVVLSRRASR